MNWTNDRTNYEETSNDDGVFHAASVRHSSSGSVNVALINDEYLGTQVFRLLELTRRSRP